ncbi:hypothetical protein, partial [Klebsiella pneumoniae]|uniref:hypothetical protein n=1 Tax=Klebsiella pneumoniae TaxID=573 RepID=UPI0040556362
VNILDSAVNPQEVLDDFIAQYANDDLDGLATNHSQESSNDQICIVDDDNIIKNRIILIEILEKTNLTSHQIELNKEENPSEFCQPTWSHTELV